VEEAGWGAYLVGTFSPASPASSPLFPPYPPSFPSPQLPPSFPLAHAQLHEAIVSAGVRWRSGSVVVAVATSNAFEVGPGCARSVGVEVVVVWDDAAV
jgi:hypothetical protein